MRTIRLTLAYDGTNYAGWQVQPEAKTVQGELESAVLRVSGESVRLLAAGRTDAGVHALGQVASFRTEASVPPHKWQPALQSVLPPDIVVIESAEAPPEFHATYSAVSKRYRYVIQRREMPDPFLGRYAWRIPEVLDLPEMQRALPHLLGTHDFRCFESSWPNKATSVRTIFDAQFQPIESWRGWSQHPVAFETTNRAGEFLCFEVEADGFLYNMVRAIVGTLVEIGRGRRLAESLREVIDAGERSQAGATAPPHGLYLVRVKYEATANS